MDNHMEGRPKEEPAMDYLRQLRRTGEDCPKMTNLFPNRQEKLKFFLKQIPCLTIDEQVQVLQHGEPLEVKYYVKASLIMSRLAIAEYNKLRRVNSVVGLFSRSKTRQNRSNELDSAYATKEFAMKNIVAMWRESMTKALRSSTGNKDVSVDVRLFYRYLEWYGVRPIKSTMDSFLQQYVWNQIRFEGAEKSPAHYYYS